MRAALSVALLLSSSASAGPQCDGAALATGGSQGMLAVLLAAGEHWEQPPRDWEGDPWPEARDAALAAFERYVTECDVNQDLLRPPGAAFKPLLDEATYGASGPIRSALADAMRGQATTSPILTQLLTPGGSALHLPQRAQVALSQVFTAGQPGLSLAVTGVLHPKSDSWFMRHTGVTGSVLVIQPVTPTDETGVTAPRPPQFASADLAFSLDGRRTALDLAYELSSAAEVAGLARRGEELAYFAAQLFLRSYVGALQLTEPQEAEARRGEAEELARSQDAYAQDSLRAAIDVARQERQQTRMRDALVLAGADARKLYRDGLRDFFRDGTVARELARTQRPFHFDAGLRARVTPRPEFVPELPDLLSAGLEGQGEGSVLSEAGGKESWIKYDFRAFAAVSAFPTRQCTHLGDCDPSTTALGELSAGLSVLVPTTAELPTVLRASVFGRGAARNVTFNGNVSRDLSAGFSASVAVPINDSLSLIGSYSLRWIEGFGRVGVSGITLSKDLSH